MIHAIHCAADPATMMIARASNPDSASFGSIFLYVSCIRRAAASIDFARHSQRGYDTGRIAQIQSPIRKRPPMGIFGTGKV